YMDLSLTYYSLFSPAARRAKGLPSDDIGVIVGTVFGGGSSAGIIQSGDVITAIDGNPVASDGSVNLDGERVEMAEIVERKFKGDTVALDVVRDGKTMSLVVPLNEPFPYSKYANAYDVAPKYLVFGGLVFQPMDQNFLNANTLENQRTRFIFDNFLADQLYREREEIVVLSSILGDPVNSFANAYIHDIIDKVNDQPIRNMQDLANALDQNADRYVLEFLGGARPFVIERSAVDEARDRILTNYGVRKDRNLTE
ncbi:MAG: PDZ domain-containing protein, partial [Chthoniobacterales bacterium]